jgi:outer membrane protein OmpA-like peptidoglycan-associated protein
MVLVFPPYVGYSETGVWSLRIDTGGLISLDSQLGEFSSGRGINVGIVGERRLFSFGGAFFRLALDTFFHKEDAPPFFNYIISPGIRFRALNDKRGYLFHLDKHCGGNIWGNLWGDFSLGLHTIGKELHIGYQIGTGYGFSFISPLQIGPFFSFTHIIKEETDNLYISFGLQGEIEIIKGSLIPSDCDNDGVPDRQDRCSYKSEDRDGFEDKDGCPELDNDEDGIYDSKDKCPDESETFNKFEDKDGCPDQSPDTDGDGLTNDRDLCPQEAEDIDNFADRDGCPDLDNDGDKIKDKEDGCPNEPETPTFPDDKDGCPDLVHVHEGKIKVIEPEFSLTFPSRRTVRIPHKFRPVLQEIGAILRANPLILLVRVEGHTDPRGNPKKNQIISFTRAKNVVDYLVTQCGVERERLEPVGRGGSKPLITVGGYNIRLQNERIEFIIIKRKK